MATITTHNSSESDLMQASSALVKLPKSRLKKSFFKCFGLGKSKTLPIHLMLDERFVSAVDQTAVWQRKIQQKKSLAIASVISSLAGSTSEPEAQRNVLLMALWAAQNLDGLAAQKNASPESIQELVDLMGTISSSAQATSSLNDALSKTLGIELGITLCIQLAAGHAGTTVDLIHEHHLQEEYESLVENQLDNDGWPDSDLLVDFGPLSASWIRCYLVLQSVSSEIDYEVVLLIDWMIRQLLRLRRDNGTLVFGFANSVAGVEAFWMMLKKASDDEDDRIIFNAMMAKQLLDTKVRREHRVAKAARVAAPYNLSEWAQSALLRSSWSTKSPYLGINFASPKDRDPSEPQCHIDLGAKRQLLIGNTMPTLEVDETPIHWSNGFEVVCDRFDEDLDYLEIQTQFEARELSDQAGTFNRQFAFSRTDNFLLVIDTIIPPENRTAKNIRYRCAWPLAEQIETLEETETREIYLQTSKRKKIQSLVLPLSLPEWKSARHDGSLTVENHRLILQQTQQGSGLVVPMLFDLNPRRSKQKRTWRRLTVAQERHSVPADHGIAYRFQLNKSQWFFYRAVATTGNRTFMGENTVAEFVLNRFETDGLVTSLIEVK